MRANESISSLQKFTDCPRCYWLSYVAGLRDTPSSAQGLGTEVHNAIKDYHLGKKVGELSDLGGRLYGVYTENVPVGIVDLPEHEFLIPMENIATGEKLPIKLHGFIDGITSFTHWLHEHKTAGNYWKQEDVDTNIQATAYAYAYFMEFGVMPEGIRFNILKKNKISCKYQSLETYRTYEDLIYFFNWAKDVFAQIEVSDFTPKQNRFGSHHHLCPYTKRDILE